MSEKKKTRKVNIVLTVFIVIIGTVLLIASASIIYTRYDLKKQAAIVNQQLAEIEEQNAELNTVKTKLEDENYIVTYAHGEYMFSKGDEKLFKLPSKD